MTAPLEPIERIRQAMAAGPQPLYAVDHYDLGALLSRLDELEKDAARYRWLRDEESAHHRAWEKLTALDCVEEEFDSIVDAAIDSAIAKGA